jgi:hypothetical protein
MIAIQRVLPLLNDGSRHRQDRIQGRSVWIFTLECVAEASTLSVTELSHGHRTQISTSTNSAGIATRASPA